MFFLSMYKQRRLRICLEMPMTSARCQAMKTESVVKLTWFVETWHLYASCVFVVNVSCNMQSNGSRPDIQGSTNPQKSWNLKHEIFKTWKLPDRAHGMQSYQSWNFVKLLERKACKNITLSSSSVNVWCEVIC